MRVALCFWGLCRSTDIVIDSIEQCLFAPLLGAGYIVDVYVHTYKIYHPYTNLRAKEFKIHLKNTNWKLLRPLESIIENQDSVDAKLGLERYRSRGDPWEHDELVGGRPFGTLDNHLRALWSLKQVTGLWLNSGKQYDTVIYARPDVQYLSPIQSEWIDNVARGQVLIPEFHLYKGCNDRFAIGVPRDMRIYGQRFDSAHEYSLHKQLHSEGFLMDHMASHGIQFVTVPMRFRRVRADGHVCEADKDI